jgi:HrpA-like RNA helicase
MRDNKCLGIVAPPGTGKSTVLVKEIYDNGATIMCVQPTIISCVNLQNFVSKSYKEKHVVAMAAERKVTYNINKLNVIRGRPLRPSTEKETGITYCTSGHVKNLMFDCVRYANAEMEKRGKRDYEGIDLNFCGFLMVDEAHAGSLDTDIIMFLYYYLEERKALLPRLLLSSATLSLEDTPYKDITLCAIKTDTYDVKIEYHETHYNIKGSKVYIDCAEKIKERHLASTVGDKDTDVWLVFCPGKKEIQTVKKCLEKDKIKGMQILCIYGEQGSTENKNSYETSIGEGNRRIIISTNIAESAITIEGVSGVFDTMTEKYNIMSESHGSKLITDHISKSSATQRKGRTGRTLPGFCYRMTTMEEYNTLPENRSREIERVSLNNTIINILDVGINPKLISQCFKVQTLSINNSFKVLDTLKMFEDNPLVITEKGQFATKVPFSVYGSSIIYEWIEFVRGTNIPIYPAIAIVAMIESYGPNYFAYPFHTKDNDCMSMSMSNDDHWNMYYKKYNGTTDLHILSNMLNDILKSKKGDRTSFKDLKFYCDENKLVGKKIIEVFTNISITMSVVKDFGNTVSSQVFDVDSIMEKMLPIICTTYNDRIFFRDRNSDTYTLAGLRGTAYSLEYRHTLSNTKTRKDTIVALGTHHSEREGKITLYVGCENIAIFPMSKSKTQQEMISCKEPTYTKKINGKIEKVIVGNLPPTIVSNRGKDSLRIEGFTSTLYYDKEVHVPAILFANVIPPIRFNSKLSETFIYKETPLTPIDYSDEFLKNLNREPEVYHESIFVSMADLISNEYE